MSFRFKQFTVRHDRCLMKVGTDGILLGAWAGIKGIRSILDIGTGSGLIALMLAQRAPEVRIDALELDGESVLQARENVSASPRADRISVIQGAIQDYAHRSATRYELLITNPPFFQNKLKSPRSGKNVARHAETLSFEELLAATVHLLAPGGRFCMILPVEEGRVFQKHALGFNLYLTRIQEVVGRAGKPAERVLLQFETQKKTLRKDSLLVIQEGSSGVWTKAFSDLTGAFYL